MTKPTRTDHPVLEVTLRPEAREWPARKSWGTIQHFVTVRGEAGGTSAACVFIPDDGSKPRRLSWPDLAADSVELKLSDGFRCTLAGGRMQLKASPEQLREAEEVFAKINDLPTAERARRHADDVAREATYHDTLTGDAGWGWSPTTHRLLKVSMPRDSLGRRYPCPRCARPVVSAGGQRCSVCAQSRPARASASGLAARLAADAKLAKLIELMLDDGATEEEAKAALAHARRRAARPSPH